MAVAPVAWALDKLQAENECYLGHLAPVLLKTYQRLDDIVRSKSENTFGWIIAECLKDGLREKDSQEYSNWTPMMQSKNFWLQLHFRGSNCDGFRKGMKQKETKSRL
ncbi:hypothetical protein Ocin01_19345 [Orchesella cincta]|uniref:Uncharacterized protein n=1 Tax=Orchesella cincta TaxID=48709 RepID=A0A1D2M2Y5_ORCCI|nr:hypothetical protein Ocin01_19345 [Orchesella cincta]